MADTLRNHFGTISAVNTEVALTVANAGTITILSFTINNNTTTIDVVVDVYWDDNSNSNNQKFLYKSLSIPAAATFEHVDKITLDPNDVLYYNVTSNSSGSTAQVEGICSYLLQT